MTTTCFNTDFEMLQKIERMKEETNMNMSKTINLLVQRGLAYSELLKEEGLKLPAKKKSKKELQEAEKQLEEIQKYGLGDGIVGRLVVDQMLAERKVIKDSQI